MRRRSRTNSRNNEDLALRDEYRDANPRCEFPRSVCRCSGDASDVHHIFHAVRVDVWSNLISLCRDAHDWCHKHGVDGKLICLGVKAAKGEIDEAELMRASVKGLDWWRDCAVANHAAAVDGQMILKGMR